MLRIRNNIFETNSSSTHSISIDNTLKIDYVLPITIKPDWYAEFGWDYEIWDTIEEKMAYMIRCLLAYDYCTEDTLQEKIKPIQEKFHNLGIDFEIPTYEEWQGGYIDHEEWYKDEIQSIYDNEDELLRFLLNNNSYIEGGNDN